MTGRRLPLKTKLLVVLLGPLLALGYFAFIQVQVLRTESQLAGDQLRQVDDNVALFDVLGAVRSERDAQLTIAGNSDATNPGSGTSGADQFFLRVRENTDERIAAVLDDPTLTPETRAQIEDIRQQLDVARTAIGDDVSGLRAQFVIEMTDPTFEITGESTMAGLLGFNALISAIIEAIDTDPDLLLDPETAVDLASIDIVTQFDEAIRLEALSYLELSFLPIEDQPEGLVTEAHVLGSRSSALEDSVILVASESYRGTLDGLLDSREYRDFQSLRAQVLASGAGEVVVSQSTILSFLLDLTTQLNNVNSTIIDGARQNALDAQSSADRRLLTDGLITGALALLVSLIALSGYRSIRRPLLKLTERSREIADVELPAVVTLLRQEGHDAEVPEIVPIEAETKDEIGELVFAFNDMHRTAVHLASEQAASRRTVADMFVNLGRRNQKLLTRILSYLDSLEEEERDPEMLEKLFKVDHLATRMRRNAESLLVLAGARASRVFGAPVPVADVARSALAEVEGYERVHLDIRGEASINGEAVADLAHLLAELMENALTFSPPTTPVVVIATSTPNGYYLAVADQGKGMTSTEFDAANRQISEAVTLEETPSKFLGHHVVGRLAARHGIEVQLVEGLVTGVTARILIPSALLSDMPETDDAAPQLIEATVEASVAAAEIPVVETPVVETVEPETVELGENQLSAAEWGRVNSITEIDAPAAPAPAPVAPAPAPVAPAPLPAPEEAPAGREVLDTSLLPRRRRDAGESVPQGTSFGDQVAHAERASNAEFHQRRTDPPVDDGPGEASTTGPNGEFVALRRRSPGATRAEHDAAQPVTEPPSYALDGEPVEKPADIREAGHAFASSLVGFQQGVTRASDDLVSQTTTQNEHQPGANNESD